MLFPQFTVRALIWLTVAAAVLAWVIREAIQEVAWAVAVCVALGSVVFSFAVYSGLFLLAILARELAARNGQVERPLYHLPPDLPPQVIESQETEG